MNPKQIFSWALPVLFILAFMYVAWQAKDLSQERKTLLFIIGSNQAEAIIKGADLFYAQYPDLAQRINIIVRTRSNTEESDPVPPADILAMKVMEVNFYEQHLPYLKKANSLVAPPGTPATRIYFGHRGLKYTDDDYLAMGLKPDPFVEEYYDYATPDDWRKMIAYLLHRYEGFTELAIEKPEPLPSEGFGVFKNGQVAKLVATWEEWLNQQKPDTTQPFVGALVGASAAQEGLLHIENAVGSELIRKGAQPVFIFGYPGSKAIQQTLFEAGSNLPRVRACISWQFKFADKDAIATLERLGVPIINAIDLYGPSMEEWKDSRKGLSSSEVAWQIAIPELSGLVQPTVLGGVSLKDNIPHKIPIPDRVERIAARAMRYVKLQEIPVAERKVSILYWNYPPGKDNVGASYLNVMRSLPQVLQALQADGYTVKGLDPRDGRQVERLIMQRGRNVGKYAPGELSALLKAGDAVLVPVSEYVAWFNELPKTYRAEITNHWGAPEKADIMTVQHEGQLHFVLPLIRFGNVSIMPQPDRARSQDIAALYHSQTLPPHHQYLCGYLWPQRNRDALIHTGTHGTQEWLEGKETGLSNTDSPEVMAGDLPIMYIYNMDVVGEGLQAKRRGAATIIDHLTPAMGEAGLTPELKELNTLMKQWDDAKALNPEGAAVAVQAIVAKAGQMGVHKDLEKQGWVSTHAPTAAETERMVEALQHYVEDIRQSTTPFGLHTFGISPEGERLDEFATLMAQVNGPDRKEEFRQALSQAGGQERQQLLAGLAGRYVRPEVGNDPIRSPHAVPTGRNFFTFDPRTVPVPYADSVGRIMADKLVADFLEEHGKHPEKITFEVWSTETIRHQGMQEAQIMGLLGVRIVRAKNGRVENLELIPREELGRPRVDVVVSTTGLYRDNFPIFIELLDKAIKLAAASPEEDNPIRRNAAKLEAELMADGLSQVEAQARSLIRIFAEPAGTYSSKMSEATYASGTWDDEAQVAELYIRRMGNGYGGGIWGESMETEFKAALSGTQGIVHSRSSNLYMALDNDDFFGFAGAIALGVRHVDQTDKSPPLLVADLRTKGKERYTSIERFLGQELRSRYFNPTYIEAMTTEGYAGARHIMNGVDWMWGWQVMYPEVINAEKWQEFYEVWLKDRYDLKTDAFFEEHSPHAKESISARMLEAVRKGYWQAEEGVQQDLAKIYVETVARHGVSCGHTTCDHPELHNFIKGVALSNSTISTADVAKWVGQVEAATNKTIAEALAQRLEDKANWRDPSQVKRFKPNQPPTEAQASENDLQAVKGYKMEEERVIDHSQTPGEAYPEEMPWMLLGVVALQVACLLGGAFWKN